jgi:hypothetical protein
MSTTRGPGRYAVRFSGEITKEAVVVLADNEMDAIARVRQALYGHRSSRGSRRSAFPDQPDDGEH